MKHAFVRLEDFCTLGSGGTPSRDQESRYYGGPIPWVKSGELRENLILDTSEKITAAALCESAAKLVPAGSILLAMYGATVGRVGILGIEAATNQAVCYLIPRQDVAFNKYVFHALRTKLPEFIGRTVGGAQPNISQQIIRQTKIYLPSLEEQRRIAAILDEADALRVKRRAALAKLDEMARAIFVEMFGDVTTNSKRWDDHLSLADVADIASGITKGRKLPSGEVRPVPYLAVINVQDRALNLKAVKEILASEDEIDRYRLRAGDLVLTEGGDPDKLGRGVLWNNELPECIHQNHIFRVRLKARDLILPMFLNWLIGSNRGKSYFLRSAKQTTGIASINMTQLRAFPLLSPPIAVQLSFVERLKELAKVADTARSSHLMFDTLFISLQHRAFRGEL